jgi:hypothetical protein
VLSDPIFKNVNMGNIFHQHFQKVLLENTYQQTEDDSTIKISFIEDQTRYLKIFKQDSTKIENFHRPKSRYLSGLFGKGEPQLTVDDFFLNICNPFYETLSIARKLGALRIQDCNEKIMAAYTVDFKKHLLTFVYHLSCSSTFLRGQATIAGIFIRAFSLYAGFERVEFVNLFRYLSFDYWTFLSNGPECFIKNAEGNLKFILLGKSTNLPMCNFLKSIIEEEDSLDYVLLD